MELHQCSCCGERNVIEISQRTFDSDTYQSVFVVQSDVIAKRLSDGTTSHLSITGSREPRYAPTRPLEKISVECRKACHLPDVVLSCSSPKADSPQMTPRDIGRTLKCMADLFESSHRRKKELTVPEARLQPDSERNSTTISFTFLHFNFSVKFKKLSSRK